jgi:hypothetical protein
MAVGLEVGSCRSEFVGSNNGVDDREHFGEHYREELADTNIVEDQ